LMLQDIALLLDFICLKARTKSQPPLSIRCGCSGHVDHRHGNHINYSKIQSWTTNGDEETVLFHINMVCVSVHA
jgi:hypothetical protein